MPAMSLPKLTIVLALMLSPLVTALPNIQQSGCANAPPTNHTTGCNRHRRNRRNEETMVEVFPGSIQTFAQFFPRDYPEGVPTAPPAFTDLWDNAIEASCGTTMCSDEIGVTSTPFAPNRGNSQIEMYLDGQFRGTDIRGELFHLLRTAFDRAVIRNVGNEQHPGEKAYQDTVEEWGPRMINAIDKDNNQLRAVLRRKGEDESCSDIAGRINAFAGLFTPFFGHVEVICGLMEEFSE